MSLRNAVIFHSELFKGYGIWEIEKKKMRGRREGKDMGNKQGKVSYNPDIKKE